MRLGRNNKISHLLIPEGYGKNQRIMGGIFSELPKFHNTCRVLKCSNVFLVKRRWE